MAIFRKGVKVGNKDIRIGLSKKRGQGILRKLGILEDDRVGKSLKKMQWEKFKPYELLLVWEKVSQCLSILDVHFTKWIWE